MMVPLGTGSLYCSISLQANKNYNKSTKFEYLLLCKIKQFLLVI